MIISLSFNITSVSFNCYNNLLTIERLYSPLLADNQETNK